MAELKTKPNKASVQDFLNNIEDSRKRSDSLKIVQIMQRAAHEEPMMWGKSIVGFGRYAYKYKSGHSGEWMMTGFSPRKQNLTIYIMSGFEQHTDLMSKLGRYKTGVSCLYIKKLEDIDQDVLCSLVEQSMAYMRRNYHQV